MCVDVCAHAGERQRETERERKRKSPCTHVFGVPAALGHHFDDTSVGFRVLLTRGTLLNKCLCCIYFLCVYSDSQGVLC